MLTPIWVPIGTRLQWIDRDTDAHTWIVWTARSKDGRCGTFLTLHNDGTATSTTVRENEGDEIMLIKPQDTQ